MMAVLATAAASAAIAGGQRSATGKVPSLLIPSLAGQDNFSSYCAPCHGRTGRGDGPVSPALTTPPADLTQLARRNDGVFPAARVRAFVTHGKPGIVAHGSSAMPIWGPTFRSLEASDKIVAIRIANVVSYIESIQQ
jgi:mono/diheme cytochrome c family protein